MESQEQEQKVNNCKWIVITKMYVNVNFCSSQAPLVPTELFRTMAEGVQSLVSLVRSGIIYYNYFIPEFGFSVCMVSYMSEQYPTLPYYQYPGQLIDDVWKGIEGMVGGGEVQEQANEEQEKEQIKEDQEKIKEQIIEEQIQKEEVREAIVYIDKDRDEDVPNSTVDTYYNEADNEIFGARSLESPRHIGSQAVMVIGPAARWQTCSKIYAMESLVRFIIVNFIL